MSRVKANIARDTILVDHMSVRVCLLWALAHAGTSYAGKWLGEGNLAAIRAGEQNMEASFHFEYRR